MVLNHNLLSAILEKGLNPSYNLGMDSVLRHLLDEEGMIYFVECFGVVQVYAVGVIPIKEVFQYLKSQKFSLP